MSKKGMGRPHPVIMKHGSVTKRLAGSRFRVLNEAFYTETSLQTQERLRVSPQQFMDYHKGYLEQTSKWNISPSVLFIDLLDRILSGKLEANSAAAPASRSIGLLDEELVAGLEDTRTVGAVKSDKNKLSSDFTGLVREQVKAVGDMGCGEAALAQALAPKYSPTITIHSYDFVALNPHVSVANIRRLPLQRHQLDLAIYCLSLMGTDYASFIQEAFRVVRPGGELWLAEVNSRITNTRQLVNLFSDCGFRKIQMMRFTHFTLISFRRLEDLEEGHPSEKKRVNLLKYDKCLVPCIYKRR